MAAIEKAGFRPGEQVGIALDVAASEFRKNGRYRMALDGTELTSEGMIDMLVRWIGQYPILSVEDPLAEELLRGNIKAGNVLHVYAAVEKLDFKVTQPEQSQPAAA